MPRSRRDALMQQHIEESRLFAEADEKLLRYNLRNLSDAEFAGLLIDRTWSCRAYGGMMYLSALREGVKNSEPWTLTYDWKHKNTVGVRSTDYEVIREWGVKALLLGFSIFRPFGKPKGSGGAGPGTLLESRNRWRETQAQQRAQSIQAYGFD